MMAICSLTHALNLPPILTPMPSLASINGSRSFAANLADILSNASDNLRGSVPPPVCNGALLGNNLSRKSCYQALHGISHSDGRREFGDRAFGTYEIPLPRRFISGMVYFMATLVAIQWHIWVWDTGDGVCAIDIFHRDGFYRDMASFREIWQVAYRLLQTCLTRGSPLYPDQGGYVRDVGMSDLLLLSAIYRYSLPTRRRLVFLALVRAVLFVLEFDCGLQRIEVHTSCVTNRHCPIRSEWEPRSST